MLRREKLTTLCVRTQLVNYPEYRGHEIKALWEWMGRTGRKLEVLGLVGPLTGRSDAFELNPPIDLGWANQSVAFRVL